MDWQDVLQAAIHESDPQIIDEKIRAAEAAIFARIQDYSCRPDSLEEQALFDALDTALEDVVGLASELLDTHERLALLERFEKVRRRLCAGEHPLINQLQQEATPEELGGKLSHAIAEWTLTSRAEAALPFGCVIGVFWRLK